MSHQTLQDVEQLEKEEENSEKSKGQGEEQKQEAEDNAKESKGENPLEKYMKMVLEARRQQQQEKVCCMIICPKLQKRSAFVHWCEATFALQ